MVGLMMLAAGPALAQQASNIRGTVTAFDGKVIAIKTNAGTEVSVDLPEAVNVAVSRPFTTAAGKPRTNMGTTSLARLAKIVACYVRADPPTTPPGHKPHDPAPGPARPGRSADLVLLHPSGTEKPVGTSRWLAGRDVDLHHHLREGRAADLARLARHVAGTARGLVLGGGGMRGFAHLGVMHAFDDAGVEVDAVAGTSIGAIMAGLRAGGLDHAARLEPSVQAMVRQGSMVPATLPLVSYSSARKVTRLLRDVPVFGWDIEDLWLPFFCVSASLGHAREVVHDRGPAWRAIRASISLPGVYPPVPHEGDLLVDGGVLNNVPVDVMSAMLRGGRILAVDLAPEEDPGPTAGFGETLSGWRVLGSRVRRRTPLHAPALPDVLVRGLMLASSRGDRARLADGAGVTLLRPPLGAGGLLDFKAGPALVDPAYRCTRDLLPSLSLDGAV